MFSTLSSLTTRSVFTFAIALLSISACGSKESKKESQEKFKEESKDVLSDTKWEQCAWSGETTVNGKLSKLYALHAWNFQKDGSFKNVLEFYASDEECKTKVSFDEVKKTFDWDLSKPGFTSLGTYKIAQLGANTGGKTLPKK